MISAHGTRCADPDIVLEGERDIGFYGNCVNSQMIPAGGGVVFYFFSLFGLLNKALSTVELV
jgi:hypothetical protein